MKIEGVRKLWDRYKYAALILANNALFGLIPGVVGQILGDIPFLAVGIPAVLSLYFDWFSSAMQAFIFCMLTMTYVNDAIGD